MPPEPPISADGVVRRESLIASRRESLLASSRRESLITTSRRESLISSSRRGSTILTEDGKVGENGSITEEGKVAENEAEVLPEPEPEPEPEPLSPEEEKRLREEEEQLRKKIAIEMRKAELRAKMEEASKARRAKKGFMTPERKKKLRLLLRKKAAEELRKEQERKANERRWIIEERCGEPEDLEWGGEEDLVDICEDYFQRVFELESDKWDLEYEIRKQTFEIAELTQKVSDLRGKFQRPILKKVSKYENKFAKLQRKAAEYNFRSQLKMVRRPDYKPKEEDKRGHAEKTTEENEIPEKVEETEEHNEEIVEEADRTSLHAEERVETPKPEMIDVEIVEGSGGPEVEGMVKSEEGLRLEGGVAVQEGAEPDGEATEGGQSPEAQGEVQPSEPLEESEPPPPPQPQHSPDDLWDYLKETVTGEHPTTVEEFVQKLIGTLEHVPEEYLTPVIDYNIKRATSPSVTDGEHQDGDHHLEGEGHGLEQTGPGENGEVASEGDHTNSVPEGGASVTQRDGFPSEDSVAHTTDIPEEPSQSAEGYSAVEGALFGGFWVAWLLYSFWDS